jgi:3-hydroxy-9,10-secoandrosta-1,3,5(10)-triene-9,17-dione monooxygenase
MTAATASDVTPRQLLANARELVPLVRAEQDASEANGHYSAELDQQFQAAGLYRLLTPKRYGGLEVDLATFVEIMVEIGRGDPGTAWNLGLGAGHALTLATFWPEQAQEEIFVNPRGYFRSPHRFTAFGTATPVEGGYRVSGKWDYCSGIRYASHFKGGARIVRPDGSEEEVVIVVPEDQFTIVDDWGGDSVLGMRASGSNSVIVEDAVIPEHWVVPMDWRPGKRTEVAPGAKLHGNPMYNGRIRLFYMLELACPVVGAAQAALDEYEEIITTKMTLSQPRVLRFQDSNFQRDFGRTMVLAAAAKSLLIRTAEEYMEASRRWVDEGEYLTPETDERLRQVAMHAGFLACEAVELAWSSASTSASKRGQRMQRYFRDIAMFRQHNGTQQLHAATQLARLHFDLPTQHGSSD